MPKEYSNTKSYSDIEFADLIRSETDRHIIDGEKVIKLIERNIVPKEILDFRKQVRLIVERGENNRGFIVTKFNTNLSIERRKRVK